MKRFKSLMFSVALAAVLLISSQAFAKEYFTLGGAGAQGRWYAEMSFFAKMITENFPDVTATGVVSPGVSRGNIKRMGMKDLQAGVIFGRDMYKAYNKIAPLDKKDYGVRIWMKCPGHLLRLIADPSIKTVHDLKGKKIGVGVRGSGDDEIAINFLKHFGLTEKDVKFQFVGRKVAQNSFANHQTDAILITYARNNQRHMGPVFSARPLGKASHYVHFKKEDLEAFVKDYPYYGIDTKGEPAFNEPELLGVYSPVMIGAHKSVDPDLMYKMTKVIVKNWDEVTKNMPWWGQEGVTPETITQIPGVSSEMFHEGALKYYKEAGLTK